METRATGRARKLLNRRENLGQTGTLYKPTALGGLGRKSSTRSNTAAPSRRRRRPRIRRVRRNVSGQTGLNAVSMRARAPGWTPGTGNLVDFSGGHSLVAMAAAGWSIDPDSRNDDACHTFPCDAVRNFEFFTKPRIDMAAYEFRFFFRYTTFDIFVCELSRRKKYQSLLRRSICQNHGSKR